MGAWNRLQYRWRLLCASPLSFCVLFTTDVLFVLSFLVPAIGKLRLGLKHQLYLTSRIVQRFGRYTYSCRAPDIPTLLEVHRDKIYHKLARFVPKLGDIVVDVGANIGEYTIVAGNAVGPQGKVIAFEPNAYAVRFLKQNSARHKLHWVHVIPKAVSSSSGAVRVYTIPGTNVADSLQPLTKTFYYVNATTLDDALSAEPHINLIKMDIEGGEWLALQGAQRVLRKKPRLIIELHGKPMYDRVVAWLCARGYHIAHKITIDPHSLWMVYFEAAA